MNADFGSPHFVYTNGTTAEPWSVNFMTANSLEFLGVKPLLGRLITPEDTWPGATPLFLMKYKFWRERFNGDPSIIGKSFTLDGIPRTLVGIMPPRFRTGWTDIDVAFTMDRNEIAEDPVLKNAYVWPLGFLKPGMTVQQAAADLDVVAHQIAKTYPDEYPKQFRVTARSFRTRVIGPFQSIVYPLFAAVAMLLLIACSYVANLLLGRPTARGREIAIRASMGASRLRLIRQLLVESFVLGATGCAGGCFFSYLGITELVPLVPYNTLPQEATIELSPPVLLFSLGVAMLATVLPGLAPAIHAVRGQLQTRLVGTGTSVGFQHGKLRAALLVVEVALSIVLLVDAGLMMRTFFALTHVDLGFSPDHIFVTSLEFPPGIYEKGPQRNLFFDPVPARLQALPCVLAATETIACPPFGGPVTEVTVPGTTHSERWTAMGDLVSEGYFQTLGLRLLRGRVLTANDVSSAQRVVVVNQTLA
jgi:putative ABC transport system permease protein